MRDFTNIQPGLYKDITHEEYHKELPRDIVSNSYLTRLKHVPAATLIPMEETKALVLGRALHCLVLETEMFDSEFAISPRFDKRTKQGKAEADKFEAENLGKSIITEDDYTSIAEMARSILSHASARTLLTDGDCEQTVIWTDETTGIRCKCRPDLIPRGDHGVMCDLKSVQSIDEYAFQRSTLSYGYHRQAAMYREGYMRVTGRIIDKFAFICVEKEPPHPVRVFDMTPEFIEGGLSEYHQLLKLEKQCRDQGFYPRHREEGVVYLYPPKYYTNPD